MKPFTKERALEVIEKLRASEADKSEMRKQVEAGEPHMMFVLFAKSKQVLS